MPWTARSGPYWARLAVSTPIVEDRLEPRARAARLGRYCSSAIAASTRSRVSSRMAGELFRTRETVWGETPATRATSRMLGARGDRTSDVIVRSCRLAARRRRAPAHYGGVAGCLTASSRPPHYADGSRERLFFRQYPAARRRGRPQARGGPRARAHEEARAELRARRQHGATH